MELLQTRESGILCQIPCEQKSLRLGWLWNCWARVEVGSGWKSGMGVEGRVGVEGGGRGMECGERVEGGERSGKSWEVEGGRWGAGWKARNGVDIEHLAAKLEGLVKVSVAWVWPTELFTFESTSGTWAQQHLK